MVKTATPSQPAARDAEPTAGLATRPGLWRVETEPGPSVPASSLGAGEDGPRFVEMDDVRLAFWQAFCHFFPSHAAAWQTRRGSLVIAWSMRGDRHATAAYSAPVVLRFEADLVITMQAAPPELRRRLAERHEPVVRAGMVGYDPYARAQSRTIVLG